MANKFSKTSSVVGERVSESFGFVANETFHANSCVFWCVLKLQSLEVYTFEPHVSNDFMAANYKRNQANNNNLIQVSCFPMPILEKLFFKNCFS